MNIKKLLLSILSFVLIVVALGTIPQPASVLAQVPGNISVQIKSNGTDNNQQTAFAYLIRNTGTSAVSGLSVRVYFTLDGSNAASNYVLEKYYDQSGAGSVSAPTLASGSTYYFTVNYGTASLAAGAQWEFQSALHLANWGTTFSGSNDHFHTGYAVGALPPAYNNTNYLPAYQSGTRVWGVEPGGVPTNTPTASTPVGSLPDLTVTNLGLVNFDPCKYSIVTVRASVANNGTANAGAFVVQVSQQSTTNVLSQTIGGLAAGQSTTADFTFSSFGTFTGLADSTSVITESNETNNSKTVTIPAIGAPCVPSATPTGPALPDLSIAGMNLVPAGPVCQNRFNLSVAVRNNTAVNVSTPFVVRLNGTQNQTVNSIAGNTTIQVVYTSFNGTNTAVVDATSVIAESNENNNSLTTTLPVSDPIATCTPSPIISITPTRTNTPTPMTDLYFSGRVTNAVTGAPIAGASVHTSHSCVPTSGWTTTTAADGTYTAGVHYLPCSTFNLQVSASGYTAYNATLSTSQVAANPVVNVALQPASTVAPTATLSPCLPPGCAEISIANMAFSPSGISINPSYTRVRWINRDTMTHSVTFDSTYEGPIDVTLAPGQWYEHRFQPPPTPDAVYAYHCKFHPSMTGTVVVDRFLSGGTYMPPTNTPFVPTRTRTPTRIATRTPTRTP